jgi:3-oxoacyl-[acyl-carrier protein] reductase
MSNKYILITGGSGGIGSSLARQLSDINLFPLITYKSNQQHAKKIAYETEGDAIYLDLSDEQSISKIINYIHINNIDIEGVVLAASYPLTIKPFKEVKKETLIKHFEIAVVGHHLLLSGLVSNFFKKNRKGKIIGVLSEAMGSYDKANMSSMSDYIISKYALQGLLSALKKENDWLEIDSISPSFTDTDMLKNAFDERFLSILRNQNQIITPDQVAKQIIKKLK